ncbi:NAD(P)/FAD-dependent oxidoreductase [Desulfosediminicola flagellatus]|uniref:NAD(P)/FAD-dependent oxidoreductase n=1 Tax=Desulfosediminicola flagellatus TaxID=2569541 RepID=UPI0010AD74B4|nr:NAD(P)/FAD-dependent oxidoreductase [Desulfosediminicola flagellatus]
MHYSVVIAGGGPAGLSCAKVLAENGIDVLLLERKPQIGPKVCAGGITWSGLINKIPGHLEEKRFPVQHIYTRRQHATITEQEPIIATVNRVKLGQHMAAIAIEAGAEIQTSCQIRKISKNSLEYTDKKSGEERTITFDYLVGADGSTSLVRRFLGLPTEHIGIGINYQIPRYVNTMEWHLQSKHFANGYGWVFPHATTVSIGAYADQRAISAKQLKKGLLRWAAGHDYDLRRHKPRAEFINFDYRGYEFDNIFLAGDAAGFASGLTGEGIYPAIITGEHVGKCIAKINMDMQQMRRLIRMQKLHARLVTLTGKSKFLSEVMAESVTFGLRYKLLNFRKLEMAH